MTGAWSTGEAGWRDGGGSDQALRRAVGLGLVLGGLVLMVGYTIVTLREVRLIEAAFGTAATGAGRDAMLPRMFLVDALGLVAMLVGIALVYSARRRTHGSALPDIREIAPHEVEAASELVVEAYHDLLGDELDADYAATIADVGDRVANATVLVAVEDGRVLGCVTYVDGQGSYAEFPDTDAAGIRMLSVSPVAQGRGIGAALIAACVERARASGYARVVLHSQEQMAAAQRLYERAGFERAPKRDWEVHPGLLLLGYELDLARGAP